MNIYEILALIALGFILRRALKSEKPFVHLNKFASHVLLTLFVFSSIASKDLDYLIEIRVVFLCVFLIIALSLGSSFLYVRLFVRDKEWAGALMVLSTYPNTEAMGYPIASLFLDDLTPAIICEHKQVDTPLHSNLRCCPLFHQEGFTQGKLDQSFKIHPNECQSTCSFAGDSWHQTPRRSVGDYEQNWMVEHPPNFDLFRFPHKS